MMQTLKPVRNGKLCICLHLDPNVAWNSLITLLRLVLLKINQQHWCYQNYKETRQSKQTRLMINPRSCSNPEWAPAYFSCTPPASATGMHLCRREVATHCTQVKPLKCVWCCPAAPWRGDNWRHCESVLTAHSGSNWHFSKWFLTFATCFSPSLISLGITYLHVQICEGDQHVFHKCNVSTLY